MDNERYYRASQASPWQRDDWQQGDTRAQSSRRRPAGLPLWSKGSIAIGVILALVAAFVSRTAVQHGDWSDGLLALALAAALLVVITLLVGIVRALTGRRATIQIALLIAVLAVIAGGGYFFAPSLHAVQAHYAQLQGQWPQAIAEFTLSGERSPNAPGIAASYVAWGEQLLARHEYASAAEKFVTVVATYAGSGHTVVARAHHDLYRTYSQWVKADARTVNYGGEGGALAAFQQYLTDPACDAACQTQMAATLALAYFQYGQQLMGGHDYAGAISQFEMVTRQYASSVYASQAHAVAAQAYFERGKQQVAARACSDAVTTYHVLVAHYADTPEAARAKAALAAPQPVSGTFSGLPANLTLTVALSTQVNTSGFVFSDDYTARLAASGAFSWPQVAQGNYNLSISRSLNGAVSYTYYHDAKGNPYTVHVGPLCPVELGTIAYKL